MGRRRERESLRVRDYILQALQVLKDKELEYHAAVAMREELQRRKALLEQVLDEQSVVSVLQRLTSQALTLVQTPTTTPPPGCEPSSFSTCIDALPASLQGYDDSILARMACMTIGDHVNVYKSFLAKAQPMALHADCHGKASYSYNELEGVTRQFSTFMVLHGCIAAPMFARHLNHNLMTFEGDAVPEGWYERVAKVLPVHKQFTELAVAATSMALAVDREGLSSLQQRVCQLSDDDQRSDLLHLSHLLESYNRGCSSQQQLMTQLRAYILMCLLNMPDFPTHKVTLMLTSCWPFLVSGRAIMSSYLQRPDVVAMMNSNTDDPGTSAPKGKRGKGGPAAAKAGASSPDDPEAGAGPFGEDEARGSGSGSGDGGAPMRKSSSGHQRQTLVHQPNTPPEEQQRTYRTQALPPPPQQQAEDAVCVDVMAGLPLVAADMAGPVHQAESPSGAQAGSGGQPLARRHSTVSGGQLTPLQLVQQHQQQMQQIQQQRQQQVGGTPHMCMPSPAAQQQQQQVGGVVQMCMPSHTAQQQQQQQVKGMAHMGMPSPAAQQQQQQPPVGQQAVLQMPCSGPVPLQLQQPRPRVSLEAYSETALPSQAYLKTEHKLSLHDGSAANPSALPLHLGTGQRQVVCNVHGAPAPDAQVPLDVIVGTVSLHPGWAPAFR